MDRIADVKVGNINLNHFRDCEGQARYLQFSSNNLQHAPVFHTYWYAFNGNRDFNRYLAIQGDFI